MTTIRGRVYQARADITTPADRNPTYVNSGWCFNIYNHGRLITWGRHYPTQQEALTRCCDTLASIKDTSTANPRTTNLSPTKRRSEPTTLAERHNG